MPRQSVGNLSIDPNVRCLRVYPVGETRKTIEGLKTVGIKLSRAQAIHLALTLLAGAREWKEMDITAYRQKPRQSDQTYQVTVTGLAEQ